MSDDRAAFEAEMKAAGYAYSTDRRAMLYADGETYRSLAWQAGWEMWRAGMRAGIERAVPREPTEEMLRVAEERNPPFGPPEHLTEEYGKRWRKRVRKAAAEQWQAMYDAAIRALEGKT